MTSDTALAKLLGKAAKRPFSEKISDAGILVAHTTCDADGVLLGTLRCEKGQALLTRRVEILAVNHFEALVDNIRLRNDECQSLSVQKQKLDGAISSEIFLRELHDRQCWPCIRSRWLLSAIERDAVKIGGKE